MSYPFNSTNTQMWEMSPLAPQPDMNNAIGYAWARVSAGGINPGPPVSNSFISNNDGLVHMLFQYMEAIHDPNNINLNVGFYSNGVLITTQSGL